MASRLHLVTTLAIGGRRGAAHALVLVRSLESAAALAADADGECAVPDLRLAATLRAQRAADRGRARLRALVHAPLLLGRRSRPGVASRGWAVGHLLLFAFFFFVRLSTRLALATIFS